MLRYFVARNIITPLISALRCVPALACLSSSHTSNSQPLFSIAAHLLWSPGVMLTENRAHMMSHDSTPQGWLLCLFLVAIPLLAQYSSSSHIYWLLSSLHLSFCLYELGLLPLTESPPLCSIHCKNLVRARLGVFGSPPWRWFSESSFEGHLMILNKS